jgi:molybdopterin-containing oxidoreductase family iron-sulfur binding subunit
METVIRRGEYRMDFLPVSCQMCSKPPCVTFCPTGASYTNSEGVVLVDFTRCIGCRFCMTSCPYNVRHFNWTDPKKAKRAMGYDEYGHPYEKRDGKKLVYVRHRSKGVVEKCTFCYQYVSEGESPACIRSCTGRARFFGDLDNPDSEVSILIKEKPVYKLLNDKGTDPKVYYVANKKTAV